MRFRKSYITILALIGVVDYIYQRLDNSDVVIGIYLDLQKAFDTVNHDILFIKLNVYGIRGVAVHKRFKNYLSGHKHYACVNEVSLIVSC